MTHVVVVGAGIVGLAAARELALRGATVTVLERGMVASGTSSRGEGNMLVSDKEIPAEATLALRSLTLWRRFAEESAEPFEFEPKGGIITASSERQLALLAAQARGQRSLGIDSAVLSAAEVHAREPHLSPTVVGGVLFPQDAQVMPIHAVRALHRSARDLGVQVRTGVTVRGLTRLGAGLRVLLTDGSADGSLDADAVVNAAGPWAGELADLLGGQAAVFPRRGMLLVTEPMPQGTVRHKVYDGRYVEAVASDDAAAQVAPVIESTRAGTILIGSTREAVGWDQGIRWDLAGQLARDAASLFPTLRGVQVIRTYQGFRPATPDHLPLVGPDVRVEGLFHDTGHEGAGIGLAMASAEVLADAVLDGVVDPAFDPRRFTADAATERVPVVASARPLDLEPSTARGRVGQELSTDHGVGLNAGGSTPAAAMLADGQQSWRTTRFDGRPRGLFCGIGHCHDCVLTDPAGATVRACLPAPAEHTAEGSLTVDVLVIGAGPGGLAAVQTLVEGAPDATVGLVDRYDAAGGQIGRQPAGAGTATGPYAPLIDAADHPEVIRLAGTTVVTVRRVRAADGRMCTEAVLDRGGALQTVLADHVVLATGAREVVAPFPGWTLPGVVTAGAVQALVKREGQAPWARIGLAGSGPLLLAVAQAMRDAGQPPVFTCESQPLSRLATAGLSTAVRFPAKAALFGRLAGAHPPRFGWRVLEAVGTDRLTAAVIAPVDGGPQRTVALDALAVSSRLVPDVALALQLGCRTVASQDGVATMVAVDEDQRTSVQDVHAVGEMTGVGGADKSIAEGRLAGHIIAARLGGGPVPEGVREEAGRWRRFATELERLYPFDHSWTATLPDTETVCRCEEVPAGEVRRAIADGAHTARAVKGLTRCGMGRCQGGVCSPLVRSALVAAGHHDTGDLETRPLNGPVTVGQLARVTGQAVATTTS